MAQIVLPQSSMDSLPRSESSDSFTSRRSSIDTLFGSDRDRRRRGFFRKLGNGFHTVFRRFSKKYKTLSELEMKILSTITHFDREEILEWFEKNN
jgi:hypothetical protein